MRIRNSLAPEQRFDELRTLKDIIFIETLSNDYDSNADGQTVHMHIVGIVALVRIALDLVPMSERNGSMRVCFQARSNSPPACNGACMTPAA
jgi:hypothetical protein